jgi:lactate dehydrogenase-like 2-hydroxyacid dehydrogenase
MTGAFHRITILPGAWPSSALLDAVRPLSEQPVTRLSAWPPSAAEFARCADSDCLLAGWKDHLDATGLARFPALRYLGLRATSTARVDLDHVRDRGITVSTIHNYGDTGTVEFVLFQMLRHTRTANGAEWPGELAGRRLGLVGFGAVGQRVGALGAALGMDVVFHKPPGHTVPPGPARWSPLPELLGSADVLSFHSPAYREVVMAADLAAARPDALALITTLGLPMSQPAFRSWQLGRTGTTVLDQCAAHDLDEELTRLPGVEVHDLYAARTVESVGRAETQMLDNLLAAAR